MDMSEDTSERPEIKPLVNGGDKSDRIDRAYNKMVKQPSMTTRIPKNGGC